MPPLTQGATLDLEDAIGSLAGAFRQAEDELRAELERVVEIVALDPNSSKRYREAQVRGLLGRIGIIRSDLEGQATIFAHESLARVYADGMGVAGAALGVGSGSFTALHREALEVLAADTFDDLAAATEYLDASAKRTIREATKIRTTIGAARGTSVEQDVRALTRVLESRGVTGFVDAAGRGWRLSTYAEMVTRTKSAHAYNTGTVLRAEETGTRVFRIADGERSRHDECLAYSGATCSGAWALEHPVQHPNCVRSFGPLPTHRGPVEHGSPTDRAAAGLVADAGPRRAGRTLPPIPRPMAADDIGSWDDARSWADARGITITDEVVRAKAVDEFRAMARAHDYVADRYPQVVDHVSEIRYSPGKPGIAAQVKGHGRNSPNSRDLPHESTTAGSTVEFTGKYLGDGFHNGKDYAVGRSGFEVFVHEYAHVVQNATPWLRHVPGAKGGALPRYTPDGKSPIQEALRAAWPKGRGIDRGLIASEISPYAATDPIEAFAEIFVLVNRPGGLAGLAEETVERIETFRRVVNSRAPGAL